MKKLILAALIVAQASFLNAQAPRPPIIKLSGLIDVSIASPTNGQSLVYNSTTGKWQNGTVAAGLTIGGSTTQVEYNNAGALGGISGATTDGTIMRLTSAQFTTPVTDNLTLSGNITTPAWTTHGARIIEIPAFLQDTTSTGTVAAAYTNVFGGNTVAATNATTFTTYIATFFNSPVAGTNVTFTNAFAAGGDSAVFGTGSLSNRVAIDSTGLLTATSPQFATGIDSGSATFSLLNTGATTVNAFGATTTLNLGASAAMILNFGGAATAAEMRFLEPSGSGTNYFGISAQPMAANKHFLWPAADGTNGQVMTTDGSGTLSFTTVSGGGGGTVTNVATTSPISGGPITTTGAIRLLTNVDFSFTARQSFTLTNATTNAVDPLLSLSHDSSGTPANNFGTGIKFSIQDSTTADTAAGNLNVAWSDVTHATHTSYFDIQLSTAGAAPADVARFSGAGGLSVGATVDPGAGIINANTAFRIGNAAAAGKILVGDGANYVASTPTFPNASATSGKLIQSDGTNWLATSFTLPSSAPASGKILQSNGTNWLSSTPTFPNSSVTAGKVIVSDGTNYIASTPTFPNASATTRKIIVSDGTNWLASTETYAVPGTSGNVLKSDGTNWTSAAEVNQTITLSGDATGSGTTAITVTNANLPDGVTQAGSLLITDIAAPASPAAAHLKIFGDSTDLRFHDKNAAGTIGTTVVADTGASNNFLSAISAAGVISKAQPAFSNLSGTWTLAQGDASNATANKVLMSGASAAPTWSTPTFPNASATTRKIIVSDGTNWTASTETYAAPGTSGNVMKSDGTNWTSGTVGGTGTVTNTGGNLTLNAVVLGAGTVDTKVSTGIITDGASKLTLGLNTSTLGQLKLFGNTSGDATIQPAAIAGTATVVTLPNASSTLPIYPQQITYTGPTAARTVTYPDADFTAARTDAANTFTGASTGTSWTMTTPVIASGLTASGSGANDFSGSTGTFKTSTGANTLGGATTINGVDTHTPPARTSGAASYFTLNIPADTGITAATESIGENHVTATRTWADGTVALQRENFFAGPTYNKTTTSATFTDPFTLYITPPIAGAGVTFTRGHSVGIVDSTSAASAITGGLVVATTLGTAATSVGIGGGNINAGGTLTVAGHDTLEGVTSTGATGTGKHVYDASPTFTGTPTLPTGTIGTTQTAGNNSTALATTAYVDATSDWGRVKVSTSDATTTGQVLVDITGLVTPTLSNSTLYEIEAVLLATTSADTTGTKYGIHGAGTGTAATCNAEIIGTTTTNASQTNTISAVDTASAVLMTTASENGTIIIKGWVTTTSSGTSTISIQHLKFTSGTSTVKVGSVLRYRKA